MNGSAMADLKAAIREMLAKGMTPEQVKDNLRELGVENADEIFAAATESLKGMNLENGTPKPREAEPQEMRMESLQTPAEQVERNLAGIVHSAPAAGSVEEKLDDAIALLKALQEINKKILEANRDVLLRLKA